MLAITAGKRLRIIEPSVLKSSTNSTNNQLPQTALDVELTSLAWTPDHSSLIVSTQNTIRRYDNKGHLKKVLYSLEDQGRITAMVVKDDTSIIFANATAAYLYNCSTNTIEKTFDEHASNIACLSLSNNASLLAISSSTACTIENLDDGSHTSLSGLPCISIAACTFHPHTTTRLLLGVGKQVLVYDVSKPMSPSRAISLASKATGDIVAISCSPFSKTLAAIACSGGIVGLVDLDKEKALFKTIDFKATLTSTSFTADGASLLVGTDSGQLFVQDLRSLDKPPRKLAIGFDNEQILAMSVQRKVSTSKGTKSNTTIKSTGLHDTTNVSSPAAARLSKTGTTGSPFKTGTTGRPAINSRITPNGSTPRAGRKPAPNAAASTPVAGNRKGSSGISPLNIGVDFENTSLQLETLPPMPALPPAWKTAQKKIGTGTASPSPPKPRARVNGAGKFATTRPSAMESVSAVVSKATASPVATARMKALTATRASSSSAGAVNTARSRGPFKAAPVTTSITTVPAQSSPTVSSASGAGKSTMRARKDSVQEKTSEKGNTISEKGTTRDKKHDNKAAMRALGVGHGRMPSSRPASGFTSGSRTGSTSRTDSARTRVTSTTSTAVASSRGVSRADPKHGEPERTPSPELPSMSLAMSPVRPAPVHKQLAAFISARSVSTASAKEAMIHETEMSDGEDEVKEWVPIAAELRGGSISEDEDSPVDADDDVAQVPLSTCSALQVSPIRGVSQSRSRNSPAGFPTPSKLPLSQATDLLRALLAESLVEFREETRAQMRGLHLDLLRVGRGMKKEVREVVGEVLGEMEVGCQCKAEVEALKEENEKLRDELRSLRMKI